MNYMRMSGGQREVEDMGMDVDPDYAMAVMESLQGDAPEDKLVDTDFYDDFEDDFDDHDLA